VWQAVFDELEDRGFVVLAVAMDQPEAARPWIEAGKPAYPCLIDRDHHLADLYHLVNVPQAVWIDETGRIVRPPETAGATDGFRAMDRTTFTMPEEKVAERTRVRQAYLDALRDWVLKGADSAHVMDASLAEARMALPTPEVALAHAHFRLGMHLLRHGAEDEAQAQFAEAIRLHPDSWAIWRQTAPKDARGLAAGAAFWARVDALGDRPYYRPVEIEGSRGPG
jgi:hypothetical protein